MDMRRLALVSILAASCASPRLMTWPEYRRIYHSTPYIIELSCAPAHLVYIGTQHTYDPQFPETALIEHMWRQLKPEIAFNEGGNPPTLADRDEAVRKAGEPGLVRHLAGRDKVLVRSIDPKRADEIRALRNWFTDEPLKMFFTLLQVKHHRTNPVEPFEQLMDRVFRILAAAGLPDSPTNLEELDTTYRRYFTGSYRDVPDHAFDPARPGSWLNEIATSGSRRRDEFMIEQLVAEMARGKRVFAVVGASHVVVQEPVIRARICR